LSVCRMNNVQLPSNSPLAAHRLRRRNQTPAHALSAPTSPQRPSENNKCRPSPHFLDSESVNRALRAPPRDQRRSEGVRTPHPPPASRLGRTRPPSGVRH
jgi:hypothetical protein